MSSPPRQLIFQYDRIVAIREKLIVFENVKLTKANINLDILGAFVESLCMSSDKVQYWFSAEKQKMSKRSYRNNYSL
jgi:hypothetical protein